MESHSIYSFMVLNKQYCIHMMSWEKASATAGLGGFTLREAARGAFQLEEFQMMEDPQVIEEKYGSIVKEVSQLLNIVNFSNIYVEHVKWCKVLCINYYRQRKGMRR